MAATPEQEISLRHLDQLSNLPLKKIPVEGEKPFPGPAPAPPKEEFLPMLERWSKENKDIITNAVKNRAYGGPAGSPVNWHYAFLAFMEAVTVYLRDWNKVVEAADAYRAENYQEALQKLDESVADINTVAALWGMKFQLLCDLLNEHSSGHTWLDGPYCGAFYSQDPGAPFIGIAFKGTNPSNYFDDMVDMDYGLQSATNGNVYSTQVSKGAYNGLFGSFGTGTPFNSIYEGIQNILKIIPNSASSEVKVHVTGHSLGGSYSSICFTELTEPSRLPASAVLGDLYTFGSPRNGDNAFAKALRDHLGSSTGSSWRISNKGDPVPGMPPVLYLPGSFNHVDTHYTISDSDPPVKGPTEIDTEPWGSIPNPFKLSHHISNAYYDAMQKALTS